MSWELLTIVVAIKKWRAHIDKKCTWLLLTVLLSLHCTHSLTSLPIKFIAYISFTLVFEY